VDAEGAALLREDAAGDGSGIALGGKPGERGDAAERLGRKFEVSRVAAFEVHERRGSLPARGERGGRGRIVAR